VNPTPRTLERINYLLDPSTLDALLDEFQSQGMPMGSDRWAEHCLTLLRQRDEEANALQAMMYSLAEVMAKRARANDGHWIEQRKRLVADHQRRTAERDRSNAAGQTPAAQEKRK
jgi:hypothetical protein